jgi:hypothetical protein
MPLDTRVDLLKHAIADALLLAAKVMRGVPQALHTGQRQEVAEAALKTIRDLPGDPWKLNEALPKDFGVMSDLGASTPDGWCKPAGGDSNDRPD